MERELAEEFACFFLLIEAREAASQTARGNRTTYPACSMGRRSLHGVDWKQSAKTSYRVDRAFTLWTALRTRGALSHRNMKSLLVPFDGQALLFSTLAERSLSSVLNVTFVMSL